MAQFDRNGGFSLRDTKIFRKHVKNDPEHTENEDLKFVEWCKKDPTCNLCPVSVGKKFAVESMHDPDSWAFHNNLRYGGKPLCELNQTVHELNRKAKSLGHSPNSKHVSPYYEIDSAEILIHTGRGRVFLSSYERVNPIKSI